MTTAYQQLASAEKSKELTTINTHKGLFVYNRIAFGIASAPGIFQRVMETVLSGVQGVVVFFDDILIAGKDYDETFAKLKIVLEKLKDAGFDTLEGKM